jgi:hypothetical protein
MKIVRNVIAVSLLFCIGTITFTACEKVEKDTPQAIKKLIRKDSKSGIWVSVTEYKCNEKIVYLFESNPFPDAVSPVYDREGNILCTLGGLEGTVTCKECKNMIEKRIIWTSKK